MDLWWSQAHSQFSKNHTAHEMTRNVNHIWLKMVHLLVCEDLRILITFHQTKIRMSRWAPHQKKIRMSLVITLAARWNCIAAGLFSPVAWQYENDGALEVRGLSISGRPKRSESNPRHSVLTESICSFQKWRSRKFSFSYFGSIMVITKLAESVYQAKKKEWKKKQSLFFR